MKKYADLGLEIEYRCRLSDLPKEVFDPVKQVQGVFFRANGCKVRVRDQEGAYTLTIKYPELGQEAETEITKEMFDSVIAEVDDIKRKIRYQLPDGWIVDHYLNEDGSTDQYLAEYEGTSAPDIPDFIENLMEEELGSDLNPEHEVLRNFIKDKEI